MTDLTLTLSYEQTIATLEAIENHYDKLLFTADEALDDQNQWLHDTTMQEARGLLPLYAAIAGFVPAGPLGHRISEYLLREAKRLNAEPPSYSDLEEYAEYVADHVKVHGTAPLTLTEWRFTGEATRQDVSA